SENLGTVFKVNKDGTGHEILRSFSASGLDGQLPIGTLMRGSDGALYGVTVYGGANQSGTVFKINQDGSGYAVLHSFNGSREDGSYANAGLTEGNNGALYGVTYQSSYQTVFKLNKDGTGYTVLHRFNLSGDDARNPEAGLLLASDRRLYGRTLSGG